MGGTQRIGVLGATNVLTVEEARKRARLMRAKALEGEDPLAKCTQRRAETLRDHSEYTSTGTRSRTRRRGRKTSAGWTDGYCRGWVRRSLAEITRADVAWLHAKMGEIAPVEGNRVLALVAVMFTKAIEWGGTSASST